MSIVKRSVLIGYFADGNIPTASSFEDLIDSTVNQADLNGTLQATGFSGSGAGLTDLRASAVSGSFGADQIPDLREKEVLFYTNTPTISGTDTVVLSWLADSAYDLILTYPQDGALVTRSSAQGDFPAGSGHYTVSGLYNDTLFSLTALLAGQTHYQRQLSVSVLLKPAEYAALLCAAGISITTATSKIYYQFNYNPMDVSMIESLGFALASTKYSAVEPPVMFGAIYKAVADFYSATTGIAPLSVAQMKALMNGVQAASGQS